jgi:hypothetical protein
MTQPPEYPYFPPGPNHPQPAPPEGPKHDGLAMASLILSIVWLGGLGSILAVIFGHRSRGESKRAGRNTSALATAGDDHRLHRHPGHCWACRHHRRRGGYHPQRPGLSEQRPAGGSRRCHDQRPAPGPDRLTDRDLRRVMQLHPW